MHLLALKCLEMVVDPQILHVRHEYRSVLPMDDVVVESVARIDCYQAKHTGNPHALLTFEDLTNADSELGLNVKRLKLAWDTLKASGKEVCLHLYTNRAADGDLAKILDGDRITPGVLDDTKQRRLRLKFKRASGIEDESEFKAFLSSLRFNLRQYDLDSLAGHIRDEWLERRLGLDGHGAFVTFIYQAERWFLERRSRPIKKGEVLQALRVDSAILPQNFPVDRRTYVHRPSFKRQIDALVDDAEGGYVAVVGPPGSGKSTFISRYVEAQERRQGRSVIRYYCFTEVNDPLGRRRVSADAFLRSMIEQLRREFGHLLPQEGLYDYSFEVFNRLLALLGRHFEDKGEQLLMVIDGLDHAERADVEDARKLLKVLPNALPSGVVCLIGTQGLQYVPPAIARECKRGRTVRTPLFDLRQTMKYLRAFEGLSKQITETRVQAIQWRSEGLPLYLRYVAEQLASVSPQRIEEKLEALPSHQGHIDRYYGGLWDEFGRSSAVRHLCGLLARLRFRISEADLLTIARLDPFQGQQALDRVRHLLDSTEAGCRVFHNSFRDFVREELPDSQLQHLNREILAYLKDRQDTPAWFAHAFEYATAAKDHAFLVDASTASYVEDALAKGRPKDEILEALTLGLKAAVETQDAIATARIAELVGHTNTRLEHHMDRVQLQRTLLVIGDSEAALAAISREGRVYDTSEDTAAALIQLATRGHRAFGKQLAISFFKAMPNQLENVEHVRSVCELLAVYGEFPAETLARSIYDLERHVRLGIESPSLHSTPDFELLGSVLELMYRFGRYHLLRALRRLLFSMSDSESIREEWFVRTAALEAEYRPETVEHHLRQAEKLVREPSRRILLSGIAATVGCDPQFVAILLGDETMLPSLDNDSAIYHRAQRDFRIFRAYVGTLAYCGRDEELKALHDYLSGGQTWMATYQLANAELASTLIRSSRNGNFSVPAELLKPIDMLIEHRARDGERIYEVFWAIEEDLPGFVELAIDGYVAAGGDVDPLARRLGRLGESELVSWHFGVGLAAADFGGEAAALEAASKHLRLRESLGPLLHSLHDKVHQQTLDTWTRTDHLLKLAQTAASCGYETLAREWLPEGLRASGGYGNRKDMTLSLLIDTAEVANRVDPGAAPQRFADIADWNGWMKKVTDGKETKWFGHYLFDLVLDFDFTLALRLLLNYRVDGSHWRFSDCLTKLLKAYDGDETQLAYLLSEVIDESTDEGGFSDKFAVRRRLLELSLTRGETVSAACLAASIRQFLLCEVSPDQRIQFIPAYNELASRHGLPTLPGITLGEEVPTPEPVRVGDEVLSVPEVIERMSQSPTVFANTRELLKEAGSFYELHRQVDEAAQNLIRRASSRQQLEVVAEVVLESAGTATDEHAALGQVYARLGDRDRSLHHYRQAFDSIHSWSLGGKRIDYLVPLIEKDRDEALDFLLRYIERLVEEYKSGLGAATLLARALELFGDDYRKSIDRIYDDFHEFVGERFAHLPDAGASPYGWLRKEPIERVPFEAAVFQLVFDEWDEPAIERRITLTHMLRDLASVQPDRILPRLLSALHQNDDTLREQSALVLHSLVLQHPQLVRPHVEAIADALESPHFEVARHLVAALRVLGEASLPVPIRTRLAALYPPVGGRELIIPPGTLGPSEHFRAQVLPRAMNSLAKTIERVADDLDIDADEMHWKIERQMWSSGYAEETSKREHQRLWDRYRRGEDVVPFESHASYHLRHAFAAVLEQIARQRGLSQDLLEDLHKRTRIYDPRLPWRNTRPKPDDLSLPHFDDRHGNLDSTPEVDSWLGFEDVPALTIGDTDSRWVNVLDFAWHSRGRLNERHFAMSRLVSRDVADAVREGRYTLQGHEAVLQFAPEPPFFTLTVEEAQHLLERSRFSLNPSLAPLVPLLCLHSGRWWYHLTSDTGGLAGPWIERLRLGWQSSDSLNMQRGGEEVVRHERWTDGRIADLYHYQQVGYGTRLSISTRMLREVLAEHGLWLLVTNDITRKISEPEYGGGGTTRERTKSSVRLLGFEQRFRFRG